MTATSDLTHICNLCSSLWQRRILNPLSKARDQRPHPHRHSVKFLTHWATTETPAIHLFDKGLISWISKVFYKSVRKLRFFEWVRYLSTGTSQKRLSKWLMSSWIGGGQQYSSRQRKLRADKIGVPVLAQRKRQTPMDESHWYAIEWKKPDAKEHIRCESIYMKSKAASVGKLNKYIF